ncbi:hypothetical protein FF38_03389 [Lucilia cuprina]|uniref:Uncharacterized protein n=1 Tax=Lucilia cuprina TaxID=7375 RepID=A0A0L0BZZ0_LUCCU|nr:hypothetical protein FF38_03389 [Lucilia cuprina]
MLIQGVLWGILPQFQTTADMIKGKWGRLNTSLIPTKPICTPVLERKIKLKSGTTSGPMGNNS